MLAPNRLRVRPASPVRVHLLAGTFGLWLGLACTGCGQGCSGEQGAEGTSTASATATSAEQDPNANGRTNGLTPEQAALVLARVGDREITAGELAARLAAEGRYTQARFASPERRREYLDKMIELALLAAEAERLGYQNDPLVVQAREQAMREEMLRELVDARVQRSDITDEAIAAYYQAHLSEYNQPAQVRAVHIVVRTRAEAQRYLQQVRDQADIAPFRALAQQHNIDDTRERGGDLLFFGMEGDGPPAPVREAAFALARMGDVSPEVIESPMGFHVVRLTGRRAALERSLDDVEGPIRNALWAAQREEARQRLLDELRGDAQIEEHLDVLDSLQLEPREEVPVPHAPDAPSETTETQAP
ncbi:MAG: peptidyl-prolyl cis-trans isomerase [Myxococcales bacterium]|nr:peptidyl-prolyl cis-trans isomerase [Myxococcales bacterium]